MRKGVVGVRRVVQALLLSLMVRGGDRRRERAVAGPGDDRPDQTESTVVREV